MRSLCPSKSFLQMNYFLSTSINSPYSNIEIPFAREDHMCWILLIMHANSKLRYLNYDSFHIEIIPCILTTFNNVFYLNSPLLLVPMFTLVRYNEWTRNMMAMHGIRLKWLTSVMISTWTFKGCLHIVVTLYGRHNGCFSCIP